MAEKSADFQTLAPRLSYVEDLANWLKDNRGSGGGGTDPSAMLKKLYHATIGFSHTTSGAFSTDIWDEEYVYADPYGERSIHVAVFGTGAARHDLTNVDMCFDNVKGFYNQVFAPGDIRWAGSTTSASLSGDIFGGGPEYLGPLRTSERSLLAAIFKDPSFIPGVSDDDSTIIGRIQQLETALEQLAANIATEISDVRSDISDINGEVDYMKSRLSNIESRLTAGGL